MYGLKVLGDSGGAFALYENSLKGNIFAQRIDADGKSMWGPKGVLLGNSHADYYSVSNLYIVSDGSDGIIVAWPDITSPLQASSHLARLDSTGRVLWRRDYAVFSSLISDGEGGVIFVFDNISESNEAQNSENVFTLVKVDSKGDSPWGFQGITIHPQRYQDNTFQITNDGNGGALVSWEEYIQADSFQIMAMKIDSTGNPVWGERGLVLCNTTEATTLVDNQITGDSSGGAVVSWHQLPIGIVEAESPEALLNDIYVQKIDADGHIAWKSNGLPLQITAAGGHPRPGNTMLASDGNGGVIVCWGDLREDIANYLSIYGQRIDNAGNIRWQAGGIKVSLAGMNPACNMVYAGLGSVITSYTSKGYETKGLHAEKLDKDSFIRWKENGVVLTDKYYTNQSISPDGKGGVIIGWGMEKGWFSAEKAYIQRIDSDGRLVWGADGIRLNK